MATLAELIVRIGADARQFEKTMGKVDRRLRQAGERWQSIGSRLTTGLTLPLAAAAGGALKASIGFESAFAGVRKTVNGTEAELAELRQGIRDMAKKDVPLTAAGISAVAEAAGQLGIQTPNVLRFTRVMVDLGETTDLAATEGAEALAQFANITQMPQTQFDRLGSAVVALGNNLATTESRIVEMGLRLAGAGNQVGLTEPQILGLAGALSSVGIEAEAGGSAFSRVMVDIASEVAAGGKRLGKFAKVAGKSADQFADKWRTDAAGALTEFVEGLGRLDQEDLFGVLEDLGFSEVRVRDALLRAAGAGDLLRRSVQLGTTAWEENTALSREAEQRYNTTESRLRKLWNRIVDVGISLGDALAPALEKVTDAMDPLIERLGRVAQWFADLDPGMQQAVVNSLAALAALGPLAMVIGAVINALSGLAGLLKGVAGKVALLAAVGGRLVFAFQAWTAGAATLGEALTFAVGGPVGWIVLGIAALVAAGYLLIRNWDRVKAFAIDTWGRIKAAYAAAAAVMLDGWGKLVSWLIKGWGEFALFFLDAWGKLKAFVLNTMAGIVDGVAEFLSVFNQEAADSARRYAATLRDQAQQERRIIEERQRALAEITRAVESAYARQAQALRDYADAELALIRARNSRATNEATREALDEHIAQVNALHRRQQEAASSAKQAADATNNWSAALEGLADAADMPEIAISDAGLVVAQRAFEHARAIGNVPGEQMALSIMEAAQALRRPAAVTLEAAGALPAEQSRQEVEINHTGTLRVEGVNSRGQLVGVTEIVAADLAANQDRFPASASVRRTWK